MAGPIKNCEGHLHSSKSIILYPALTSPALVYGDGSLCLIVAGDEVLKKACEKEVGALKVGKSLGPEGMRFCHSHLSLIDWRDLKGEPKKIPGGNPTVYSEPYGSERFIKGEHWRSEMIDRTSFKNVIYKTTQHGDFASLVKNGICSGFYIGNLNSSSDTDMLIYLRGDTKKPFGILGKSAIALFKNKNPYIFHLEFTKIPYQVNKMMEIIWSSCGYVLDQHFHFNPTEETVLPEFTKQIVKGGAKAEYEQTLLTPADRSARTYLAPTNIPIDSDFTRADDLRCDNGYALFNLGANFLRTPKQTQEENTHFLACMRQDGRLYGPRHPVMFSKKPLLSVGVIADPHISSRQALYKLVGARVIPGVDTFDSAAWEDNVIKIKEQGVPVAPPKATDSPLIGRMAHDNLQSTRDVFQQMMNDAGVDIITFVGDMYDHIRNCHPAEYVNRAGGTKTATRTGYLWKMMDYSKFKKDRKAYPRFIDAMMALELIYQSYARNTPVLFTAGNHEGYEHPYGISPRVGGKDPGLIKPNDGIPLDHNLTFYEAVLLYGRKFHELTLEITNGTSLNFFEDNFDWLYTTMSPWKDVFISYEEKQNFVLLDWGRGEEFFFNALGGDTLPVAKGAITDQQLELMERAERENGPESKTMNILVPHFTFAAYTKTKPLFIDCYEEGLPLPNDKQTVRTGTDGPISDGWSLDTGTFTDNQERVWEIVTKSFSYVLSGHTHRMGLYRLSLKPFYVNPHGKVSKKRMIQALYTPELTVPGKPIAITGVPGPLALVSGSCGTFNKQNFYGELAGQGMDKPQGMVLAFGGEEATASAEGSAPVSRTIRIVKSKTPKPRLAVSVDYLAEHKKCLFEGQTLIQEKPPTASPYYQEGFPTPDVDIFRAHIYCLGMKEQYRFRANPAFLKLFRNKTALNQTGAGAFPTAMPVGYIKLHAVHFSDKQSSHLGCLFMRLDKQATQATEARLEATGAQMTAFKQYIEGSFKSGVEFFISVHFDESEGVEYLKETYDVSTPWSFPVTLFDFMGMQQITLGWKPGFVKMGEEVPNFDKLVKLMAAEYK